MPKYHGPSALLLPLARQAVDFIGCQVANVISGNTPGRFLGVFLTDLNNLQKHLAALQASTVTPMISTQQVKLTW